MPQLDITSFFSQYFWLILFFFFFYIILLKIVFPKLSRLQKFRLSRGDIIFNKENFYDYIDLSAMIPSVFLSDCFSKKEQISFVNSQVSHKIYSSYILSCCFHFSFANPPYPGFVNVSPFVVKYLSVLHLCCYF